MDNNKTGIEALRKRQAGRDASTPEVRDGRGTLQGNSKFCQHCGAVIDTDCVVCPQCGKQVAQIKAEVPQVKSEAPQIIINNSNQSKNTNTNANTNVNGRFSKKRKRHGLLWWLCIGWWYWLLIGWWWRPLWRILGH